MRHREVTAMSERADQEYRDLVQQLMHAGWYRVCQEWNATGVTCRFREGHLVDAHPMNERVVSGDDPKDAMRKLLQDLNARHIVAQT